MKELGLFLMAFRMRFNRILYLDNKETIYTRAIRDELKNHANIVDCFFYDEIYSSAIFQKIFFSVTNQNQ